jgi:hypothetical protein
MYLRRRTRYRRVAAAACRIYGLTIWLYPPEFRRVFGRELAITFRTRLEDVLEAGSAPDMLAFAAHIAFDMISTYRMLLTPMEVSGDAMAVSLLGLSEGEIALGGLRRAPLDLDIQLMFAAAGVVFAFAGWFVFLVILPKMIC